MGKFLFAIYCLSTAMVFGFGMWNQHSHLLSFPASGIDLPFAVVLSAHILIAAIAGVITYFLITRFLKLSF